MQISDAFQAPVVLTWPDGSTQQFPLLVLSDYAQWAKDIEAERVRQALRAIPANAGAAERVRIHRDAATQRATMDEVSYLVWTPEGAVKVLQISLARAGLKPAEAQAVIDRIPAHYVVPLAAEVCALYERRAEPAASENGDGKADEPATTTFADAAGADPLPGGAREARTFAGSTPTG